MKNCAAPTKHQHLPGKFLGCRTRRSYLQTLLIAAIIGIAVRGVAQVTVRPPVTLLSVTALPGFVGDFDHFAVDLKRNRLLLAAEEHHTLEVFDLRKIGRASCRERV